MSKGYRITINLCVFCFLACATLHAVLGNKEDLTLFRAAQISGVLIFLIEFSVPVLGNSQVFRQQRFKVAIYLFVFTVVFGGISRLARDTMYFRDFVYLFVFLGVGWAIIRGAVSQIVIGVVFYSVCAYFAFQVSIGASPVDWVKGSQNHVSIVLISLCSLYCLHRYQTTGKIYITPAILTLIFSCLAIGRSGILSSGIIVLGLLLLKLRTRRAAFIILFLGLPGLIIGSQYVADIVGFISPSFRRFDRFGMESYGRRYVLEYYMANLDGFGVLFGSDIEDLKYSDAKLTAHNSFLSWHMKFGFGSFFLYSLCLVSIVKLAMRNHVYLVFFCSLLIRGATDEVLYVNTLLMGVPFVVVLLTDQSKMAVMHWRGGRYVAGPPRAVQQGSGMGLRGAPS